MQFKKYLLFSINGLLQKPMWGFVSTCMNGIEQQSNILITEQEQQKMHCHVKIKNYTLQYDLIYMPDINRLISTMCIHQ